MSIQSYNDDGIPRLSNISQVDDTPILSLKLPDRVDKPNPLQNQHTHPTAHIYEPLAEGTERGMKSDVGHSWYHSSFRRLILWAGVRMSGR